MVFWDQRPARGTYKAKAWKWQRQCQINFGLQLLSNFPKKYVFANRNKFRRALSGRNFEFWPWKKIVCLFLKNKLILLPKNKNLALEPSIFKISTFFASATPNIFKFYGGLFLLTFFLRWKLKGLLPVFCNKFKQKFSFFPFWNWFSFNRLSIPGKCIILFNRKFNLPKTTRNTIFFLKTTKWQSQLF